MATYSEAQLRDLVSEASGQDAAWTSWHVIENQAATVRDDVARIKAHPLIPDSVVVGGFLYDVDTGLLKRLV
jgi:carbonic anhydrase